MGDAVFWFMKLLLCGKRKGTLIKDYIEGFGKSIPD